MQRFEKWFFLLLAGFHLVYIWQQKYFLTADGPAHVYNSKILLDLLCGKSVPFYLQYYDLNLTPSPNWFTHTLLMPLLFIFNPITAEKILLSFYVLLFPISFWFAIKQIAGKVNSLIILVFPFIFHFLLYYGFYNYSFSIPFALLFIGSWSKLKDAPLLKQVFVLFPLSFLVFVTHIFGWFVAGVFLASAFLIENILIVRQQALKKVWKNFWNKWLVLFVAGLIPVVLSVIFMQQNETETQYYPEKPDRLWEVFRSLEMLVLWGTNWEKSLVQIMVSLLVLLFSVQLFFRVKNKNPVSLADGWLISAIIFFVIYFAQPPFLFLAGYWIGRMSWIGWLFLAAWLSSFPLPTFVQRTATGVAFLLIALLAIERFPFQQKTSDALADYLSAVEKIPAESRVLPLSFSHHGMDEKGNYVDSYRWKFQHAFDYCGAYKPVINYANYEATTTWFPLHWKQGCNPFEKFNRGMGIEWNPPDAHLNPLDKSSCHFDVDYVVTWCMAFSDSSTEQWHSVNQQLQQDYLQVYESPTSRTAVWKRKIL